MSLVSRRPRRSRSLEGVAEGIAAKYPVGQQFQF